MLKQFLNCMNLAVKDRISRVMNSSQSIVFKLLAKSNFICKISFCQILDLLYQFVFCCFEVNGKKYLDSDLRGE